MITVQKDPTVFHFSHPHPLEYTTAEGPSTVIRCSGCKLRVTFGEDYYQCITCAFSLHHVCYNMPLITNHPSHTKHELVLFLVPSSPAKKSTFNCVACKHHVMGLCYHCAECNIFFHPLCLALPLSLTITYHPHKIKLEFSPPYDFFCDLCNKPSYNGWLYRCSMCEFDIHIACAVENIEPKLFIKDQSLPHTRFGGSVGDSTTGYYDYKIMSLVAQQIGGGINRSQEDFDSAIVGWDKKLYSPRKKHSISSGKMKTVEELELEETELSTSDFVVKLEERTPLRDQSTPLSDHASPPSSYQFSDSYFSIDLTKSYSTHERRSQVRKEVSSDHKTKSVVRPSNSKPFGLVNWPSNGLYNTAHQNKLNAAFSKGGDFGESSQKIVMKNPNENLAKWSVKDQTITKSEPDRNSRSGWKKLLTCCL
ncbi:Zinc finger, PHD-type [Sesbania bispinosa]|nr:Zinc finger, PHD-type [Sesbania bispinosa]